LVSGFDDEGYKAGFVQRVSQGKPCKPVIQEEFQGCVEKQPCHEGMADEVE
jgi:hypothetical protein